MDSELYGVDGEAESDDAVEGSIYAMGFELRVES